MPQATPNKDAIAPAGLQVGWLGGWSARQRVRAGWMRKGRAPPRAGRSPVCAREATPAVWCGRTFHHSRKWAASRLNPIRWGDRAQLDVGPHPEQEPLVISRKRPIEIDWERVPDDLKQRVEALGNELGPYAADSQVAGSWRGRDVRWLGMWRRPKGPPRSQPDRSGARVRSGAR